MLIPKKCPFYRGSQGLAMGKGLGYCDLDGDQAICDGDTQFCKNPEILRKQLLAQKSEEESNNNEKGGQQKKPSKYKILVVDDEEPMRKLMVALFSKLGHECITANNGREALDKIGQHKFDAVITDIIMPEMDGITLTKEILTLYPNLPIMVMTGFSKDYSPELAIAAGAYDFIKKPFSIDEFVLRFSKIIRDREMFSKIEAKQNEIEAQQNEKVFHLNRKSSEEIDKLKRELESLKSRLYSGYSGLSR